MNTKPTVSVIIPNYNYSRYLEARLESVLGQDYTDMEVIILDDASTDNSLEIINKFASDGRISHIVVNERNTGNPFLQWKRGIQLAEGQYIWIAESDDWAEKDFLSSMVRELDKNQECVLAYSSSIIVDESDRPVKKPPIRGRTLYFNGRIFIKRYMSLANRIYNASAVVFRKSASDCIDESYTSFKSAGDYYFWSQIIGKGDVAYVRINSNHYRIHADSVTGESFASGISSKEDRFVLDFLKETVGVSLFRECLSASHHRKLYSNTAFPCEQIRNEVYNTWSIGKRIPSFFYECFFFIQTCVRVFLGKLI